MKRALLLLSALLVAVPASSADFRLVDPDAPKTDPGPPVYHPPAPTPTPPVYHPPAPSPPVYYPPTPTPAPAPHPTTWYNVDLYIPGYGTTPIEFRTFSSGLKTIVAYGPGGKEKMKKVNCWSMEWRAVHNRNPYRFQHEVVKAVCARYR